ncbi:Molybdopterin-synthase adenylyltransferase [hydrothermal vent metagenome]|uniref:Molybdopterin-synthase adenylyltransferase n=1 Tax=hydrothermal vent metagenome TaxID=652676 RepID=A0A3B1DZN9_9ZZZZ
MPSRYHRQQILPGIGTEGQARLAASHAAIIGMGALGCAIADHLARAGVGTLTLIDRDLVEFTNLQRQVLYTEADATEALPKAEAARARLAAINSEITIHAHIADLTAANADALLAGDVTKTDQRRAGDTPPSILLDGTDNFETRYLLNDLAVRDSIPLVYGGVVATHGMQMTIRPGVTPCLRCLFEDPPAPGTQPTCDTAGVLGPVVAIVAACQAADAMRCLLGQGEKIPQTLLEFDLWAGQRRRIDLAGARREDCPCCGRGEYEFLSRESASDTLSLCGQEAVQVRPGGGGGGEGRALDLSALAVRLASAGEVDARPFMLRFTPRGEQSETGGSMTLTIFRDGRAIIAGTTSPERARSLYARYVGA